MAILNLSNSHARTPAPSPDDSGIETDLGALRTNADQVAQVTANLAATVEPAEPDQGEASKRDDREQSNMIEARYALALSEQIEAKRSQATQLEQRLTKQAQQHSERLGKLKQKPPRALSFPSTKRRWNNEVRKESTRLYQAEARLLVVREIRDGMGPLIPRLQEVAAAKLRTNQPELVKARDEARVLERAQIQQGRAGQIQERERKTRSRSQELSATKS